jgi:S-adenosylmethionine/arginine decarboxylase-like enzyme
MIAKMNKWSGWITETDPVTLDNTYKTRLLTAGFKILKECEHHFQPYGYTKLYLLAESHFAIHTFPEEGKTYIELSSCVDEPFNRFMSYEQTATDTGNKQGGNSPA